MQLAFAATGSAALVASPVLAATMGWKPALAAFGLGCACGLILLLEDGTIFDGPYRR